VPNGHPGNSSATIDTDGRANDLTIEVEAVGAAGGAPLPGFLEGLFVSRANAQERRAARLDPTRVSHEA
jgi:hypothetical protein